MASGLVVAANFKPESGGVAEHAHRLALHLAGLGERIAVLALAMPGAETFDAGCGYPVIRCRLPARGPLLRVRRMAAFARAVAGAAMRVRADYLVCAPWEAKAGLAVGFASLWTRVPYVLFAYGIEFSGPTRWRALRRLSARRAARVVCLSGYTGSFVAREGVPPDRIVVVPPGIELAAYEAYRRRASTERVPAVDAAFAPGAPTVLTVCRLVPRKQVERMIEAMPQVLAAVPAARYVVVGDGAGAERLREFAAASPAAGAITFLGALDEDAKLACYQRCAVFALPSDREGFGIVFLEAGAFARPSVGPRTEPETGAVIDGETGLLVDAADTDAVAAAVVRLLSDPDEARRLGDNARRRVETEFGWPLRAGQVLAVIRAVCAGRAAPRQS